MVQIFVAILAGVYAKWAGQPWLWSDMQILAMRWWNGGAAFGVEEERVERAGCTVKN